MVLYILFTTYRSKEIIAKKPCRDGKNTGLKNRHNKERDEGESTGLKTRHYERVKQETIRAQNHRAWEEVLRTVYPPVPRANPSPFSGTPHRETSPPDAQQPVSG